MRESPIENDLTVESLVAEVADEFTQRVEAGEHPDVEEYARQYPQLASVLREILPALCALGPGHSGDSNDAAGGAFGCPTTGVLGDYALIREIGRGGMGVVYEARQVSLGRRVALKMLPFAGVLDKKQLQRFRNEAQAAAQLHHPHIVPVHSIGCERGVHYYAMQYIDGQPLSAVIQELRHTGGIVSGADRPIGDSASEGLASSVESQSERPIGATSSAIDLLSVGGPDGDSRISLAGTDTARSRAYGQAVARLGVQAADALQHAHEQGVIHRDIKPSNLILDGEANLWITDFGLAMMQTDAGLTLPGDLVGTLRYMSPEQTRSRPVLLDHRTDIYSLGVTLYELLALRPAFDGQDRHELLHRISMEEPPALRRINRAIPRELEIIVAKAMSKGREERYDTAQDMADDLRRFLQDKPIQAKPPTVLDRTAKWSRRHRPIVVSVAVLLMLALGGLSASTVLIARARNDALVQCDLARTEQIRAEANLRIARSAVDRMLSWVAAGELTDIPTEVTAHRQLLEDSLAFHENLLVEKSTDSAVHRDSAHACLQVGYVNSLLGRDERAEEAYLRGIQEFETLCQMKPGQPEYQEELANGCLQLALMRWQRKHLAEAETPARRAVASLEDLDRRYPDTLPYCEQLGRGLVVLGLVLRDTVRLSEAEKSLNRSIALRERLRERYPDDHRQRLELARMHRYMADVLIKAGRADDSARHITTSIALQEELVERFPDDPGYAAELTRTHEWWHGVASLEDMSGAAGRLVDHGPSSRPALSGADGAPASLESLARTFSSLSRALRRTGQIREAQAAYQQAATVQDKLVQLHPEVRKYHDDLWKLHSEQGLMMLMAWRLKESEAAYSAAVDTLERALAQYPGNVEYERQLQIERDSVRTAQGRAGVGDLVLGAKQSPNGVVRAIEVMRRMDPETVPPNPYMRLVYADFLILGGEPDRAVQVIRDIGQFGGTMTAFQKSLGWALITCGRHDEARVALEAALKDDKGQDLARRDWSADTWAAAHFLDRVSAEEFTARWHNSALCFGHMGSFPWFYIGARLELEGRSAEAMTAYRSAVEAAARVSNPHLTANWAAYRLSLLSGTGIEPTTQPAEAISSPIIQQQKGRIGDKLVTNG